MPTDIYSDRQSVASNNPLLRSAQADVQAAEKQYESAKSPFYPRFDAELATNADNDASGENGHANGWRAGVSMNYNLFNGMRDKARLQSSAYKINEAMDIRNNALRELNENLALAWNAMDNARLQTPATMLIIQHVCARPISSSSPWANAPCWICSTVKTNCSPPTAATPKCATPKSSPCTG